LCETGEHDTRSNMAARLKLQALSCARGGRMIFAAVGFTLEAGDALLVRGPNGVGKSSLLRIIAGLLPPHSGHMEIAGQVALADRMLALDINMPLAKALAFWASMDGGDTNLGLVAMDLGPLSAVPVRMLSSGQRQRSALARVIASNAEIWLLDEPSNAMDTASIKQLESAISAHRASGGIVVIATHNDIHVPDAHVLELTPCA